MASMRWIFGGLLILALVVVVAPVQANAMGYDVTATLTADNDFILYTSNADGTINQVGPNGQLNPNPSVATGNDWTQASTLNVHTDRYLYILAWNDLSLPTTNSNPQAWLGQFTVPGYQTLYSDLTQWHYIYSTPDSYGKPSGNPSVKSNPVPTLSTVQGLISGGGWGTPVAALANGAVPSNTTYDPWYYAHSNHTTDGRISGIDPAAYWIWSDTFNQSSVSENGYVIFRADLSALTPVPLPASVLLLGSGLMGLGLMGYRSKKS